MNKHTVSMHYTNHRGERKLRRFVPIHVWHGLSMYHEGEQWFIKAYDIDKKAVRDFAFSGFLEKSNT